jgi:hypothetical protein
MTVISEEEETQEYKIKCRIVHITTVIVEAVSQEDAIKQFQAGDWVDDGMYRGEMVDFEMIGEPRK